MYMEIGSRGNGKTERLLEFAQKNNAVVICNNPFAMKEKAREYGIQDIKCISYYDTLYADEKYVVDELYFYLKNKNIIGFSYGVE